MDLCICDLPREKTGTLNIPTDTKMIVPGRIHHCIGCFGCWIKTPGECVIHDGYEDMGKLFAHAERVTVISECCYGGYSPFVKNVFDRSIGYISPNFRIVNGEMHHRCRYARRFRMRVLFYGDTTEDERETARAVVKANGVNFYFDIEDIRFAADSGEIAL